MTARRTSPPLVAGRPNGRRSPGTVLTDLADLLGSIPHLEGALCRGRADVFDLEPSADAEAVERAKLVCRSCPALTPCAAWVDGLPPHQRPSGVAAGELLVPPRLTRGAEIDLWLADRLANGPVISAELKRAAAADGHSGGGLSDSAHRLGVLRTGGSRSGVWALPEPGRAALNPDRARDDEQGLPHRVTRPKLPTEPMGGQFDALELLAEVTSA